jgi:hypothetical protein
MKSKSTIRSMLTSVYVNEQNTCYRSTAIFPALLGNTLRYVTFVRNSVKHWMYGCVRPLGPLDTDDFLSCLSSMYCSCYVAFLFVTTLYQFERLHSEKEKNDCEVKNNGRTAVVPVLRYYPGICLKELKRKLERPLDSRILGRHWNSGSPEYKTVTLIPSQQHSVPLMWNQPTVYVVSSFSPSEICQ